ncbi:hypothetical protein BU14_0521s0010 [Porphyra umbilicalis]|uniref:Apple domain-containing protein n=1 Tax=Porphyra umbilicalis TaxID=2786 RepID=A0A1X6NSM8_PORUM|nr:hypothetical protein BU14_0521s0010 [Porphyra umbilicalis]|eukprot:OSX71577.1 hypothetical protein BU14_0521s0010 [Porphyra umbilicalis]
MARSYSFRSTVVAGATVLAAAAAALVAVAPGGADAAFSWRRSSGDNVLWAPGCDWPGNDVGSVRVPGSRCGSTCRRYSWCTHFSWTLHEGGTCWLKDGRNLRLSGARRSSRPGAVCGLKY